MTIGWRVSTITRFAIVTSVGCAHMAASTATQSPTWLARAVGGAQVEYQSPDSVVVGLMSSNAALGLRSIDAFLGSADHSMITLRSYPTRADFNAYWIQNAQNFTIACWMIGRTIAGRVELLSPRVWSAEGCGHRSDDPVEIQRVITHELIHAIQFQMNPLPDVNASADTKWFNEGIAVYVSGQLDSTATSQVRVLVESGQSPTALADVMRSGTAYPLAGSLVAYLDRRWGRTATTRAFKARSTTELLGELSVAEKDFIGAWQAWVRAGVMTP